MELGGSGLLWTFLTRMEMVSDLFAARSITGPTLPTLLANDAYSLLGTQDWEVEGQGSRSLWESLEVVRAVGCGLHADAPYISKHSFACPPDGGEG